jgi:hypothetical protein
MSACLSVRMEKFGLHWTDFQEILYLNIFPKPVENIQVSLKSNRNSVYLHERQYTFLSYLANFMLNNVPYVR